MTTPTRALAVMDMPPGLWSSAELWALQLILAAQRRGMVCVHSRAPSQPIGSALPTADVAVLRAALAEGEALLKGWDGLPAQQVLPATVIRLLGADLAQAWGPFTRPTARAIGLSRATDTHLSPEAREQAAAMDLLVAGSAWQRDLLFSAGLRDVIVQPPGFDGRVFTPRTRRGVFGDRFVIYTCGALEYRKGQDIVIAALRTFLRQHDDALLVCLWDHPTPEIIRPFDAAGHVQGLPSVRAGGLDVKPWLVRNGLPDGSIVSFPLSPNPELATLVHEADVAVFASRAEAEPNSAALECLACGIPTILSGHTGHAELRGVPGVIALETSHGVRGCPDDIRGRDGWGEPEVDDLVAQLQAAYDRGRVPPEDAASAAAAVAPWRWEQQLPAFLDLLEPLFTAVG